MKILSELEAFINDFNSSNNEDFSIDTIRVEFNKQYKLQELKKLGKWVKVEKNSSLLSKLKKRLLTKEITSAYRLEDKNIYYYNKRDKPKYRKAILVIFGIHQYNKQSIPKELISKILNILKNVSSIDICIDLPYKPKIEALLQYFELTPYRSNNINNANTIYINSTNIMMIDKIVIYNKAYKNKLHYPLWRVEATISIPNFKILSLPLYELKQIIDLIRK